MLPSRSRRHFVLGALTSVVAACAPSRVAPPAGSVPADAHTASALDEIELRIGGRVGVFALDTATGRALARRPDERFAMCSTFKWVLAAAVLARVDQGALSLEDRLTYGEADLLEYAPVTRAHVGEGAMAIEALAEAVVTLSDNTAANLLLAKLGGPAAVTELARSQNDLVTRLDRTEPTLNTNVAGDARDTTSPRAMVGLMRSVLAGDALSRAGRERLVGWMRACETGKERLRAGLPSGWVVGDKTGSGERSAVNDVAIAVPPGRAPILIAAYLSDSAASMSALQAAHADVGRAVADELGAPAGEVTRDRADRSTWGSR